MNAGSAAAPGVALPMGPAGKSRYQGVVTAADGCSQVKHIYVSPHADDVALSCGGQILMNPDRGNDTLVLTAFTSEDASPAAASIVRSKFVDAIHDQRDKEDEAAWNSVGVPRHALGLPEALLRHTFPFAIIGSGTALEIKRQLLSTIASYMQAYPNAKFYFPAGIGRHVDHLLCRDVAVELLRTHPRARIVLYEDAPYSWLRFLRRLHYRESGLISTHARAIDSATRGIGLRDYLVRRDVPFPRGRKLFLAVLLGSLARATRGAAVDLRMFDPTISTVTVDDESLSRKRELIHQYASQLPMLFGPTVDALLAKYAECFGSETTLELSGRPV